MAGHSDWMMAVHLGAQLADALAELKVEERAAPMVEQMDGLTDYWLVVMKVSCWAGKMVALMGKKKAVLMVCLQAVLMARWSVVAKA
jgi:hypothetical protein